MAPRVSLPTLTNLARRDSTRHYLGLAIRWILGLGLTGLALYQVDLAGLWNGLRQAGVGWLIADLATILLGIGLKAVRWKRLLEPAGVTGSFSDILGALMTGQAVNIILPLRGGELVRTGLVVSPKDGRSGAVLMGIGIEKAFDLLALAACAAAALPLLPSGNPPAPWVEPLVSGVVLLGGALALGLFSQRAWRRLRPFLDGRPASARTRFQGWIDQLSKGLDRLSRSGQFGQILALTVLIWLVMLSTNMILLTALGMRVSAGAALLVLVAALVAQIPRIMPGNVGPFYLAVELGLAPFGYSPTQAVPYAVLLHALVTLTPLAGAGLYLGIGWRPGRGPR
jgi:uncharacterized membrane protein YbhN (UPF0104 family)